MVAAISARLSGVSTPDSNNRWYGVLAVSYTLRTLAPCLVLDTSFIVGWKKLT